MKSLFDPIYVALTLINIPFFLYAAYSVVVALAGFKKYEQYPHVRPKNRFAAVIAARNEAGVIGQLVDSLRAAKYPEELLDIWVIPNNCSDDTGAVARAHGALTYDPRGEIHSKGDALKEFFDHTFRCNDNYDAFCVFDADNLVDANFFSAMNDVLESGEQIVQGYRESKNPKDSWISGSQSMFYWITNRFLNRAKRAFGLSAALNGTGFMVSRDVLYKEGFDTHSMTEDIEYTTQSVLKGYKVAFAADAVTYDEHPTDFDTSWKQRKRWSTGVIQVFYSYGPQLWQKFKETGKWIHMDMFLYLLAPYMQVVGTLFMLFSFGLYIGIALYSQYMSARFIVTFVMLFAGFLFSVLYTAFVCRFERHQLSDCCRSTFTAFWWFLMTWSAINMVVFFKPITVWEPIEHKKGVALEDLPAAAVSLQE